MPDVKFPCPHCDQHMVAPEEMLGDTVDCPACKSRIRVPLVSSLPGRGFAQPLLADQRDSGVNAEKCAPMQPGNQRQDLPVPPSWVSAKTSAPRDLLFKCPLCSKFLVIDVRAAGGSCTCTECQSPVAIPVPAVEFTCRGCGHELSVPAGLTAAVAQCPECDLELAVGGAPAQIVSASAGEAAAGGREDRAMDGQTSPTPSAPAPNEMLSFDDTVHPMGDWINVGRLILLGDGFMFMNYGRAYFQGGGDHLWVGSGVLGAVMDATKEKREYREALSKAQAEAQVTKARVRTVPIMSQYLDLDGCLWFKGMDIADIRACNERSSSALSSSEVPSRLSISTNRDAKPMEWRFLFAQTPTNAQAKAIMQWMKAIKDRNAQVRS